MNPQLCGRQFENQPSAADVNCLEAKHIADKRPIRLSILAVEEKMHPVYHGFSLTRKACAGCGAKRQPIQEFPERCAEISRRFLISIRQSPTTKSRQLHSSSFARSPDSTSLPKRTRKPS